MHMCLLTLHVEFENRYTFFPLYATNTFCKTVSLKRVHIFPCASRLHSRRQILRRVPQNSDGLSVLTMLLAIDFEATVKNDLSLPLLTSIRE